MSEFLDGLLQKLLEEMYQGLWTWTSKMYDLMQGTLSSGITKSRNLVGQSPQSWNKVAYDFVKGVAEDAAIPIAACILTFVFCWQIISMVQEGNQMHNIKPETMVILMIKLGICILVCSKSFEIVNGLFDIADWGINHIPYSFSVEEGTVSLEDIAPREVERYDFGMVVEMLGNGLLTLIAILITYVLSIAIYIRVNIWYLELLIYASAAPIPLSTFMNKEWGQVGTNYLRKMLAMSFEGFFMIVAFSLYGALVGHATQLTASYSYLMAMATNIGCGVALVILLSKTGNISASIFNAH